MNETFYVTVATALPILLLSSAFLELRAAGQPRDRFGYWIIKTLLFTLALASLSGAIGFAQVLFALRAGEPLSSVGETWLSIVTVGLFSSSVGLLAGKLLRQASELPKPGRMQEAPTVRATKVEQGSVRTTRLLAKRSR